MSTHTSGPWRTAVYRTASGRARLQVWQDKSGSPGFGEYKIADSVTFEEDAQLIAAAPEMLRALQRITHPAADDDDLAYAQSIIKKALGKA